MINKIQFMNKTRRQLCLKIAEEFFMFSVASFAIAIGKTNAFIYGRFSSVAEASECLKEAGWKQGKKERDESGWNSAWIKGHHRAYIVPVRKIVPFRRFSKYL